jgi:hypothetical protein
VLNSGEIAEGKKERREKDSLLPNVKYCFRETFVLEAFSTSICFCGSGFCRSLARKNHLYLLIKFCFQRVNFYGT